MKKIVTIIGARPQFVKAAVLSRIIRKQGLLEEVIVHTGQHFDTNMSAVFFEEMQIPRPKYNLDINELGHGAMTGQMLEKIEEVLLVEKPAMVIVYGDTNSTLAGALAAKKLHIKVVHVEAGLRSFNMRMPEEVNRILTDRISDLLCCPTTTAIENLKAEGFDDFESEVMLTGDIMKDAVIHYSKMAEEKSAIISKLGLENDAFVLATIHRQENTDDPNRLRELFKGLDLVHESLKVILPLHPRTAQRLKDQKIATNVKLIDPVGYFDMLQLLNKCVLVITDSGGLQKEAFFCKKNALVLRDETEWIELVDRNFAKLVRPKATEIFSAVNEWAGNKDFDEPIFGTHVGQRIYEAIVKMVDS
ncbi:non-hydrolyzing UDP-N-acetylglucosamine 2-epimerase [Sungkyunkwania multivorans]|uniref:Non-hydrolyzing UDP-N-acetylglucosamine 2-epimerase n=1 Tax=Sungkyunkwania multivorans TaxID=1173618 RepID=A0ABW3CZK4_9FLAO